MKIISIGTNGNTSLGIRLDKSNPYMIESHKNSYDTLKSEYTYE